MTDDKENNIDRDNSIVNDNNKDKEIFFFVLSRACDKEKLLSPRWESNLRPSDFARRYFTTEPQRLLGERGLLQSSNAALVITMMTMTIETDGDSKNVDDSNKKDGESNDHIENDNDDDDHNDKDRNSDTENHVDDESVMTFQLRRRI